MTPAGFPHSDIHGSLPAFGYPWLFVDRYVLLRLPVPRHPPCALLSLTCQQFLHCCLCQSCSNHFSLGSHFFSLTHLAVQCVGVLFCLFGFTFFLFLLYSVFKVPLRGGAVRRDCTSRSVSAFDLHSCRSWLLSDFSGASRWWAQVDSNHRPHAYQACALTT